MKITVSRTYTIPDEENCKGCKQYLRGGYFGGLCYGYCNAFGEEDEDIDNFKPCPDCLKARKER